MARCLFLVSFYNELDRFSPLTSIISLDVHHFDRELKGTVHLKMKTGGKFSPSRQQGINFKGIVHPNLYLI